MTTTAPGQFVRLAVRARVLAGAGLLIATVTLASDLKAVPTRWLSAESLDDFESGLGDLEKELAELAREPSERSLSNGSGGE